MFQEFEVVVLTEALPDEGLEAGDTGTVVEIYGNGKGYELEIFNAVGDTIAVVTVFASQIRPLSENDIHHVRVLTS